MGSHDQYIAIDLKSFYASVECRARDLDPLTTNLVVADVSRTEKTICLAVSPSLKAYGIGGRARLFEVVQGVRRVNSARDRVLRSSIASRKCSPLPADETVAHLLPTDTVGTALEAYEALKLRRFRASSFNDTYVRAHPDVELDYLIAKPRMALYVEHSTKIYEVYLKFFAPEDIHVYSIDEVLIDATPYLRAYHMSAEDLASKVVADIFETTGITATAGIGTNLYLAKVAMDILAKHEEPNEHGVRIATLDEENYKRRLWSHTPLTDFWRVGKGTAERLRNVGIHTMGDIARCSLGGKDAYRNEDLLFDLFGKNAELLIDHAWGYEPVTMAEVKAYTPKAKSSVSGQVLMRPYSFDEARLVVWEMADQLALDLTSARLVTDTFVLTVSYDRQSLANVDSEDGSANIVVTDWYGRSVPKPAHGTVHLKERSSSSHEITSAVLALYDEIVNADFFVRKINIAADDLIEEAVALDLAKHAQRSLFDDEEAEQEAKEMLARERKVQDAMLEIREKFGKNAILKAPSLQEGATAQQRNKQIGGHSA